MLWNLPSVQRSPSSSAPDKNVLLAFWVFYGREEFQWIVEQSSYNFYVVLEDCDMLEDNDRERYFILWHLPSVQRSPPPLSLFDKVLLAISLPAQATKAYPVSSRRIRSTARDLLIWLVTFDSWFILSPCRLIIASVLRFNLSILSRALRPHYFPIVRARGHETQSPSLYSPIAPA